MKLKAMLAAAWIAALLGGGPASAQIYPRQAPPPGPFKKGPPPQPVPARQDDRERTGPPPGRGPFDRMSPEERGQLRRDIERHGREIYPDPRRERRR